MKKNIIMALLALVALTGKAQVQPRSPDGKGTGATHYSPAGLMVG